MAKLDQKNLAEKRDFGNLRFFLPRAKKVQENTYYVLYILGYLRVAAKNVLVFNGRAIKSLTLRA